MAGTSVENDTACALAHGTVTRYAATNNITTMLFCGEQCDAALKMYKLRARYYDPSNARFDQMDTFAGHDDDPQSLHKYNYTHCGPVNGLDRTGLSDILEFSLTALVWGILAGFILGALAFTITLIRTKSWELALLNGGRTFLLTVFAFLSPAFAASMLVAAPVTLALGIYSDDITKKDIPEIAAYVATGLVLAYLFKAQAPFGFQFRANAISADATASGSQAGNYGLGSGTTAEAMAAGKAHVGPGFKVSSNGKYLISADRLRQFRPPSYKPKLGKWQANLEQRAQPKGKWTSNGHVDIVEPNPIRGWAAATAAAVAAGDDDGSQD